MVRVAIYGAGEAGAQLAAALRGTKTTKAKAKSHTNVDPDVTMADEDPREQDCACRASAPPLTLPIPCLHVYSTLPQQASCVRAVVMDSRRRGPLGSAGIRLWSFSASDRAMVRRWSAASMAELTRIACRWQ